MKFKDGSAYVLFDGCNWKCSYCVWREVTRWSLCLPEERRKELDMLWINGRVRYLRLEEVVSMLKRNSVKFAFFGGGEPTLDPELKPLLRALSREGIKVWLVTNGENLDEEIINLVEGVTFSIKALDRELHRRITGVSNEKVLENLRRFGKSGKIVAETVFVPGLVECDEIERIARFIASINPSIPLRVDPLVQGASVEKVDECIERITEVKAYRIKVKGKIEPPEVIYPVI